jgi:CRISPR-associated protein (TIGR03984 family)
MVAKLESVRCEGVVLTSEHHAAVDAQLLVDRLVAEMSDGAVVLGWSTDSVGVGLVRGGQVEGSDGQALDTSRWFAARAFDGIVDARWSARRVDGGHLVVVREAEASAAVGTGATARPVAARVTGLRYLLFGERDAGSDGWTTLSAANIGAITIPHQGGQGRIAIEAVEYVTFDEDGNADVFDERLVRLIDLEVNR